MANGPVTIRVAASDGEVTAAYELAARVFGPSYFEARAAKQLVLNEVEPIGDLADVVIAVERSGGVVGLIRLVSRRLRFGTDVFKAGGITSVCVDPAYRARGIGAGLMKVAMGECRRRGDDLSVLFARRAVDGWYPKFGFVGIGQHPELRLPPGKSATSPRVGRRTLRVRRGFEAESLPAYRAAYEASYDRQPGSFIRSRDWWRRLEHRLRLRKTGEFLSLTAPGAGIVGYALVEADRILELAVPVRDAAVAATLLTTDRHAQGFSSVGFHLHPVHSAMKALYRRNHTLSVRRAWDGGHMAAALTPLAARRLESLGLSVKGGSASFDSLWLWPVWSPLDEF